MIFKDYVYKEKKKRGLNVADMVEVAGKELGIGRTAVYDLMRVPPKGELGVMPRKKLMMRIMKWSRNEVDPNSWYGV